MKLKDVFDDIFIGFNLTNASVDDNNVNYYKTLQKDSIQYTNIILEKLNEKVFSSKIKKKYFLQDKDIIIFIKKPYRVGLYTLSNDLNIIIPNNFIVLRSINEDLYSCTFLANYLERIGIEKFVTDNNINGNLSIEYIKDIELPSIPKEEQLKYIRVLKNINKRSAMYSNIIDNDNKIIDYFLNIAIGDKYEK